MGVYAEVLRCPGAPRVLAALAAGWSSFGMVVLGTFLTVHHATGSSVIAGIAVGAESLAAAVFAPLRGRLIDRRGVRPWLAVMTGVYALSLVSLAVAATRGAPAWTLVALSTTTGLGGPPLVATTRTVWPLVVPHARLRAAYALTSLVGDVGMVVGPPLAAGLMVVGVWVPLVCCAAAALVAAWLVSTGPVPEPVAVTRGRNAPPRARDMGTLLLVSVALGATSGLIDVATPAAAISWDRRAWAGVLLGMFAAGSVVGSLWFGRRAWSRPALHRYLASVATLALLLSPAALATDVVALAAVLALAGAAYGPATVSLFESLDDLMPDRGTEALTGITTAEAAGAAPGAAAAGWLVGAWSPGIAFACGALVLACAAIPALIARRA